MKPLPFRFPALPPAPAGVAVLLLLAGVAHGQATLRGTPSQGRILFHSSAVGNNGLACSHCHADFDESRRPDGRIRAAHSLHNAARRETWWGQEKEDPDLYPDISHAAVVCVEHYMLNPDRLTAQQLTHLQEYLVSITPRPTRSPLALTPAADKTGEYNGFEGGDRIRGRQLFHAACHSCHPNGNAGLAPVAIPRGKPASFYARKVREGDGLGAVLSGLDPNAYDPEGGFYMPFFGADRLSNQELRDIIAFLQRLPPRPN